MTLFEYIGLDWRIAFTAVTFIVLLATEIFALRIPQGKNFTLVGAITAVLVTTAVWVQVALWRVIILDITALILVAYVWFQDKAAGKLFLSAVVIGSTLVIIGMALGGLFAGEAEMPQGNLAKIVISLIVIGFAIKLAFIPFSFWLAPLCERTSAMTAVLVISMLDIAEFGELALLRVETPWIFSSIQWVWVALALLSMFGGALLALAQTNIRRMLAFSTIDDMGYLVLGLAAGTAGGVLGGLIGLLSHALCKFLLFGAVGAAEDDLKHPVTTSDRGLATRNPVSATAFIVGAMGMIGIPPFLGFLGRWRLYFCGIELGGITLGIVMSAATALALLYYVRTIHKVWLGKSEDESVVEFKRITAIEIIFIILTILLIIAGIFPAILPGLGGR